MTCGVSSPAGNLAGENFRLPLAPADVCLVCMPYCDPELPSLALGLLQAVLMEGGIEARSIYANLLFCEELGVALYERNHPGDSHLPLAEWSFAATAFPEFQPDENHFVGEIHARIGGLRKQSLEECRAELRFIRLQAERFTTRLAAQILKLSPRIVGCTSSLFQRVPSLALLRKIRELNPDVITIMGGADCETVMGRATHQHFPWVDFVVSGEGEDLILPLAKSIFEFGRRIPPEALPEGVFAPPHRQFGYPGAKQNGDEGLPRAVAGSFERQITPVYQDYFDTLRSLPAMGKIVRPGLPIQASRGCWHGKCKFCGLNTPRIPYRSRPAAGVLAELEELSRRYGVEHFEFLDNILDMRYFRDLIPELIRRGAPYKMFYEIRSNLSKKHFKMMREAGIAWCQPGIESLHSEALKAMNKGVAAWQNIQTLKWCRQFGINVSWGILHDFPGDQDRWYQEMAELVPLLTHLNPPCTIHNVQYQRNSHYFDRAADYSLKLTAIPLQTLIYPLNPGAINDLSYTFEDEFKNDPLMAVLFDRSGLRNLQRAVFQWSVASISQNKPVLSMKVDDEQVIVRDNRPVAVAPSFRLDGAQRELYLACDRAEDETQVREMLLGKGFSSSDVDAALRTLLDSKLLVRVDQRLLALAVEEPYLEYLSEDQNPYGWISADCGSMLGRPIEFMKSYIKDMAGKGLLDSRYLPADC
ncbi:RiPP maturation radical SAM C-methyltransferase [Pelotomaculum terephthalicicum JT]|uniref:RiPP maturation radical SAM C-methyltransferase n=1 Tax=Pelotomaculum TaxID=191373 RepID=UPI0009CD2254|nr:MULTISPECIES: RiPP maturation radical SAM C-methyltransferase [Pelotomaculum]MCG9966569.1 RiPP maturation radical SAM C-methyltransferase [Pelotomaculum terephthalicicum JT]OPX92345.1 MAG: Radical SAM superfamily protein [Pelotomaculum sp. PtaB.Bin117]